MKKLIIAILMMVSGGAAMAQDFQFHYDFGRNLYGTEESSRARTTLTYEQFKADRLGSWYWFVDFDLYGDGMKGAYTEISREFTLGKVASATSWAAHIEYDGGMTTSRGGFGSRFQHAALLGAALNGHNADFSTTWSLQAMYKQYFDGQYADAYASMQLTGVWSTTFLAGKCTFSGFCDLWRGKKGNGHGQLVLLAEPQLWYNIDKHFSIGTEVEVSDNFIFPDIPTDKSFYVNPTLAVKYNF